MASVSARKLIIAGALTLAATIPTIAPAVFAPTNLSAQQCITGEEGDAYTGTCVPYLVPNSPASRSGIYVPQPGQPGPLAPSPEEQELQDIATPGY
jgi:hypothetical protein